MLNEESYYDILGVNEDATALEIRQAFLKWAQKLHPDKHPQASTAEKKEFTEAFQRIHQAYEVLRDYREDYDWEQKFYGAKSHSEEPKQESGFPFYKKANKESSQPSSAEDASCGSTKENENSKSANASAWAEEAESQSSGEAHNEKTDSQPSGEPQNLKTESHESENPQNGKTYSQWNEKPQNEKTYSQWSWSENPQNYKTDSQWSWNEKPHNEKTYCQWSWNENPQNYKTDSQWSWSENPQKNVKTPPCWQEKEAVFGTRADGQPCQRCLMYGKFCFQHTDQDPQFHKENLNKSRTTNKKEHSRPSPSDAGHDFRKEHSFGTRADGQPCQRCQAQGKFCFQHVNQVPTFCAQDTKHDASANWRQSAKKVPGQSHARFGTRADGQPCRRCEKQGKYCFQHT
ncbi:hypothetical protein FisN_9Lh376 [Fistulifera solaris]|uniref:J domain-containing protein n=1 Tax=Fistulifera solaris TaxID=1519565 RepID=A0A1Z5KLQ3_FISSO|nr:hypothetical protein FisN_9Lh376 [Fistulifera solaris]|eukprot:GAX27055.1 hypothetical protein FisN_9Lh376 [Fistulifera solaris]